MKKLILLAATMVATFAFGVTVFAAAPSTLKVENMALNWSDEFNGNQLDSNIWTPQIGNGSWGWGNDEKQYYKKDNITVSDGTMKITAKYEVTTTPSGNTYNYTSGRINSSGKKNIGLGYVEARIKIPSAQGIWPAFWMLGTNGKVWPSCGEIDIMEAFNTRATLQSTIHYPNWEGGDVYAYAQTNAYDKTQWHTYGCYRDGKIVAFYIDGVLLKEYSTEDIPAGKNKAGQRSVLNDDHYLLFNVACGGNLAGGTPPTTAGWNAVMEVDYVRYYTGDPTVAPTTTQTVDVNKQTTPVAASVAKPKRVQITKAKNIKKRKISLKFKKIKGVKGYQIRWCENRRFNGYEQKTTSKTKMTLKGLSKKTTYFIKVRAYKMSGKKKLYGTWSKVKKVKVKK